MRAHTEPETDDARRERRTRWGVFLFTASLFLLTSTGHIRTPDGVVMYRVSQSLLEGELSVPGLKTFPGFGGPAAGEGRIHAWFGLGHSLASMPFTALGEALAPLARDGEREVFHFPHPPGSPIDEHLLWYGTERADFPDAFTAYAATWTNAFVVAAMLALLHALLRRLGYGLRTATAVALLAGLATPLWHYAREHFSEPLAGLALVAFLHGVVRARDEGGGLRLGLVCGGVLGLTVLTKVAHGVLLAPAGLLVMGCLWRLPRDRALRLLLGGIIGLGAAFGLMALYNAARFGSPLETGYGDEAGVWSTPFHEGFLGLLLSPGRGLLLYCPLVLVSAAAARSFARAHRDVALFVAGSLGALLLLYSRWEMWEGGWCWGPRFLMPVLPLLLLPIAEVIEHPPVTRTARVALWSIVALSAVMAVSGLLVSYADYYGWLRGAFAELQSRFASTATNDYPLLQWDWRFAPALGWWFFPLKEAFLLPRALEVQSGLVLTTFGLWLIGAGAGAWLLASPALRLDLLPLLQIGVSTLPLPASSSRGELVAQARLRTRFRTRRSREQPGGRVARRRSRWVGGPFTSPRRCARLRTCGGVE